MSLSLTHSFFLLFLCFSAYRDAGMGNLYVLTAARDCWRKGRERFPANHIMHNEMGNILVQV